ncbi:27324_t:CDS:1, partial [Dentiscutata erythropus]
TQLSNLFSNNTSSSTSAQSSNLYSNNTSLFTSNQLSNQESSSSHQEAKVYKF